MTLLMNTPTQEVEDFRNQSTLKPQVNEADELSIRVSSSYHQPSAMPEELKQRKRKNAASLFELFNKTLEDRIDYQPTKANWVSPNEVEVEGLSQTTLHSFILKAEELGKKITYNKTLTVKISD